MEIIITTLILACLIILYLIRLKIVTIKGELSKLAINKGLEQIPDPQGYTGSTLWVYPKVKDKK